MKRKLFTIQLILLSALFVGCGKNATQTKEPENVYEIAQIKKILTYDDATTFIYINEYDEKGNETKETRLHDGEVSHVYDYDYKYNKKGFLTKKTTKINGKWDDVETYKYDHKGNLTQKTECFLDIDGTKWYIKTSWEYNDNGQKIKEYEDGILIYSWEYDSNGVKTECLYREDGSLKYQVVYDSDGNMKHYLSYASDGSIETELVYENEYDSAGKKIKNTEYIIEGKNKKVLCELKYNENEILTEKIGYIYYQGDIISCVNFEEYDNQGNLLKKVSTDSDGSSDQQEYEYDSRGNQIKYTHINRDGSVYKEESEYDDKGNIIRWTSSTDGVTGKEEKYEYVYRE